MWMLGTALAKIASYLEQSMNPAAELAGMKGLVNRITLLEVTNVQELLEDPWLRDAGPGDLDELRLLSHPLFLTCSSLSSHPEQKQAAADRFLADVGLVDTGLGYWRVFRVGAEVTGLSLGDKVLKVDGKEPKNQPEQAGAFYSEMSLLVDEQPRRTVTMRRTVLEQVAVAEPDWERFRRYLVTDGAGRGWPADGRFHLEQLRTTFVR